jgi:polyhydroxyalkanoate synthesis regulator phasin
MAKQLEAIKKSFLIGVGATVSTAEKVKELIDDLVERGELTKKDAKTFGEELKKRTLQEKEVFEKRVKETVETQVKNQIQRVVQNLGLATKEELARLRSELQKQEKPAAVKNTRLEVAKPRLVATKSATSGKSTTSSSKTVAPAKKAASTPTNSTPAKKSVTAVASKTAAKKATPLKKATPATATKTASGSSQNSKKVLSKTSR